MNYELKDKITVTKELLDELKAHGWQEIERLQVQINNLANSEQSIQVKQLLKNLLTSYYIFTGGIETISDDPSYFDTKVLDIPEKQVEPTRVDKEPGVLSTTDDFTVEDTTDASVVEVTEPFEYFVDFDEPTGDPITDDDLYNN